MEPEGCIPSGIPLVHDPGVPFRLHALVDARKRVLPRQLREIRGRQRQRQRAGGLARWQSRRVGLAVPHEHVKKDRAQSVAVQGQFLAEGHGVEAPNGAGSGHHPRQHLLARHPRDDQQLGRALRLPIEVAEPRARRRCLVLDVVLHHGRDVDETRPAQSHTSESDLMSSDSPHQTHALLQRGRVRRTYLFSAANGEASRA